MRRTALLKQKGWHNFGVDCIPFVMETYGGLGMKAQEFLNELSIFAIDHLTSRSRFDVVSGPRYAIACSVPQQMSIAGN